MSIQSAKPSHSNLFKIYTEPVASYAFLLNLTALDVTWKRWGRRAPVRFPGTPVRTLLRLSGLHQFLRNPRPPQSKPLQGPCSCFSCGLKYLPTLPVCIATPDQGSILDTMQSVISRNLRLYKIGLILFLK